MVRLMILFGIVLAIALVVVYISVIIIYPKAKKSKPHMTNNEYDNYPED